MTFQNTTLSNELYAIANGSTSSLPFVDVFMSRDPTPNDTQYAIQKKWLNTSTNNLWMLKGFTPTGGIVQAIWIQFGVALSVESFAIDASTAPGTNPVLPNGLGVVTITGGQVAAGTTANVIQTDSLAANTYTIQIQRSQAAATSTIADNGVAHFNSAEFTVDANGFVSLVGGGSAIEAIDVQTGTSPVVPLAGVLTINGALVAAGTHPVRSDGTGANTLAIEVQTAQAIASTNAANVGLAAFNSAQFTVDANGFVSIAAGTGVVETLTGNSGGAISPVAGNINTVGTGSITIVGTGNTLTTQLTGLTNHDVLVGAGTATITSVSPSTAGFVLTSNGVGADPSFQAISASGGITSITGNTGGPEIPSAGNFNILGTGSITVAGSANTETVQLTGLTAHNVLLGEGTATIGVVAPSATSGVPLISQGASSDPAFGTAVVAGGGTGNTTFTAYAVITAGTTATGAFQNVLGLGTAGQVLTSTGAGALPSWQNGASILTITPVNHAASPYTALATDEYLKVDVSGGVVTLLLPNTTTTGRVIYVKDSTGGASTSNITVTTVGGTVTIDGLTSYIMNSNYQAISLIFDGTNYEVF